MTVEEALFSDPSGARGAADSVLSICPAGRETTQEVAESPCSDGSKRTNDCLFSEERVQNDSDSTGAVAAESETSPPGKTKFSHPAFPRASSSRLLHSRMVQMLRRGTAPAAARRQKSNSQASTSSSVYGSSSSSSGGRGDFMNVSRWSTGCRSSSVRNVKQRITGIPEHAPIVAWKNVNICYGENSTVASDLVRGLLEACSRAARRDRRATLSSRMSSARQSAASSELQGWRHTKSDSSRTSGLSRLSESLRLRRSRTQKIYVEIPVQDLLVSSVINTTSDSPGAAEKDLLSPSEDEGTTRENLISKRQGKSLASVFSETASRKSYGEKTESVLVSCNPRLVRSWQDDVDTYAAISLFIALDGVVDFSDFTLWSRSVLLRGKASSLYVIMDKEREAECRRLFPETANFMLIDSPAVRMSFKSGTSSAISTPRESSRTNDDLAVQYPLYGILQTALTDLLRTEDPSHTDFDGSSAQRVARCVPCKRCCGVAS